MTKKDYELIAGTFKHIADWQVEGVEDKQWLRIVKTFNEVLAHENEKFDRKKFLTACGIES